MKQNIEYGDWVYLKSAPEIKVKVTIINPNRIIDFRSQRSEPPYFAHEEDVVKLPCRFSIYKTRIPFDGRDQNRNEKDDF
jgi:hypothetical protein